MSSSAATDPASLIDVIIDADVWSASEISEDGVRCAASAVLHKLEQPLGDSQVTVLLTSDARVQELNSQFRGLEKPTNVLSFPADEDDYLGDIALAYGTVVDEAVEQGIELSAHVSHLVVHGVLHLLGYDHQTDTEAEKMENLEVEILAGLGIANPYLMTDRSDIAKATG